MSDIVEQIERTLLRLTFSEICAYNNTTVQEIVEYLVSEGTLELPLMDTFNNNNKDRMNG